MKGTTRDFDLRFIIFKATVASRGDKGGNLRGRSTLASVRVVSTCRKMAAPVFIIYIDGT